MARHRRENPKKLPHRVVKAAVAFGVLAGVSAVFSTGFALFVAMLIG